MSFEGNTAGAILDKHTGERSANDTILKRLGLSPAEVRKLVREAKPSAALPVNEKAKDLAQFDLAQIAAELTELGMEPIAVPSFVCLVTPALAKAWLDAHNKGNRKPSRRKILRFAAMMQDGVWDLNGEALKFSRTGKLLDGQSRLMAIVEANKAMHLEVRFSLEDTNQETMDSGENRKLSHTLEMRGYKNANNLAASLGMLNLYLQGAMTSYAASKGVKPRRIYFGNRQGLELIAKHPGIQQALLSANRDPMKRWMPPSRLGCLFYIFRQADEAKALIFEEAMRGGVGLEIGSPALALRNRLMQVAQEDYPFPLAAKIAITIKAWNAYMAGEKKNVLVWKQSEPIPAVSGCQLLKPA